MKGLDYRGLGTRTAILTNLGLFKSPWLAGDLGRENPGF